MQTQGYPLEMQIARIAQEVGLMAHQGFHYYDSEQQVHREIDVMVTTGRAQSRTGRSLQLRVVFEAKSSTGRSKPWVILADKSSTMANPARVVQRYVNDQAKDWWRRSVGRSQAVHGLSLFDVDDVRGYSLIRPTLAAGGSRDDQAFSAMMQVSKAAHGVCEWLTETGSKSKRPRDSSELFAIVLPVVVVDSPLYQCWLDGDGQIQLEEVGVGTVKWGNRVSLRRSPNTIIKVMRLDAVRKYLQDLEIAADVLYEDMMRWSRETDGELGAGA
ncbi:hypothetical protein AB0P21_28625 [Kribbella sp. NPDC056861]|uniref:hypothetical protein n=1 Tax=Kribbella sp. NPDC056861 TaxID=3154857 RepID=UPI00343A9710